MTGVVTIPRILVATLILLAVLLAIGWSTRDNPADRPYLKVTGSGFVFNYRVAQAFYGFTAYLDKPAPRYSVIEAEFENPSGGEPIVVSEKLSARTRSYSFRTPPLDEIEKHKPYKVHLKLIRHGDNVLLHDEVFTVASQQDSSVLPEKALTIGPGYHRNPELAPAGH